MTSSSSPARATSRVRRSTASCSPSTTATSRARSFGGRLWIDRHRIGTHAAVSKGRDQAQTRRPSTARHRTRRVIELSWEELAGLALGELRGAPAGGLVRRVHADSRVAEPGDLFVALNTGVSFVDDALDRGAAALVPDDQHARAGNPRLPRPLALRRTRRRRRRLDRKDVDEGCAGSLVRSRDADRVRRRRARTTRSDYRSPCCASSRRHACS